jgi:anti-sigma factor (TIGR02949 family)
LLTCKQFLDELSEFLDDTVSAEDRKKLEEHICACPNCWVLTDTTKKTIEVYRKTEPVDLPEGVRGRLMAALERKMTATKKGSCS